MPSAQRAKTSECGLAGAPISRSGASYEVANRGGGTWLLRRTPAAKRIARGAMPWNDTEAAPAST